MRLRLDRVAPVMLCGLALAAGDSIAQSAQDSESRVRSLYEGGEWAEAARVATEAKLDSADRDLYRGLALARMGQFEEARQAFLDGQRKRPGDHRFGLELAGIAYRNQDVRTAKKWLRKALRLDPPNTYGNDFLATLFLLDDNLPAALKYWNRIDKPLIQELRFEPRPPLDPLLTERMLAISAGQVFTLDRLQTTEANLNRLGVLAAYRFDLGPRQDQRFDLTFHSFDAARPLSGPLSGWPGAVLPLVAGLPYQTIDVDLYNLGQRAVNFAALGRWDSNKRRIALQFEGPMRLNPRWKYRMGIDARDENWDLRTSYFGKPGGLNRLVLRKIEAGVESNFGLTARLQWTSGLWVSRRGFQGADQSPFFADSWSFQLRNGLAYRLWTWPERRVRVETSAQLGAGRVLTGAPSRFATVEGALNGAWLPQAKGDDVAVLMRMRAATTFGVLPFDEFFMLGMERDNDLWMRGHVGTRDGRKGSAPVGSEYALFQSEVERTVVKFPFARLQIGPFFDAGRIADRWGQFGSRGWMEDAGVQSKIRTLGRVTWTLVYGRDLRDGRGVFYTSVSK